MSPPSPLSQKQKRTISILIALSVFTTIIATDIYLPSMPKMATYFGVSSDDMQLTLTINLLALSLSPFLFGFLVDWKGPRLIILTGLTIFTFGSLIAALSDSIHLFYLARALQGTGGSAIAVAGFTSIRGFYDAKTTAKVFAYQGAGISLGPALAPALGGIIDTHLHWRLSFYVILFLATAMLLLMHTFFPKALSPNKKGSTMKGGIKNYWKLLKAPKYTTLLLVHPLFFSAMWCFISVAGFYFIETLNIRPDHFGFFLMASVLAYPFSTLTLSRIVKKYELSKVALCGAMITVSGSIGLFILYRLFPQNPFLIISCTATMIFGMGFTFSTTMTLALSIIPNTQGTATALLNTARMGAAAVGSYSGVLFYDHSLTQVTLYMTTVACLGLGFLILHRSLPGPKNP